MTSCARCGRCFSGPQLSAGEICQFDLWEPRDEVSVGHAQTGKAFVVVACLGHSRAGTVEGTAEVRAQGVRGKPSSCFRTQVVAGGYPSTYGGDRARRVPPRQALLRRQSYETVASHCGLT